jgi:hypothetical protein
MLMEHGTAHGDGKSRKSIANPGDRCDLTRRVYEGSRMSMALGQDDATAEGSEIPIDKRRPKLSRVPHLHETTPVFSRVHPQSGVYSLQIQSRRQRQHGTRRSAVAPPPQHYQAEQEGLQGATCHQRRIEGD